MQMISQICPRIQITRSFYSSNFSTFQTSVQSLFTRTSCSKHFVRSLFQRQTQSTPRSVVRTVRTSTRQYPLGFGIKICRTRSSRNKKEKRKKEERKILSPCRFSAQKQQITRRPSRTLWKTLWMLSKRTNGTLAPPFCNPARPCDFAKVASVALFTPPLLPASPPQATTLPARISIPFCAARRETVLPHSHRINRPPSLSSLCFFHLFPQLRVSGCTL